MNAFRKFIQRHDYVVTTGAFLTAIVALNYYFYSYLDSIFSQLEAGNNVNKKRVGHKVRASVTREELINRADAVVRRYKEERGAPGISVGVSVNGAVFWKRGYGYVDVENLTPCTGDSVMRIASISKPLTMSIVAKLMEENRLDIDAPVQKYVSEFPEKEFEGEKVALTTRHLLSHMGGVRNYKKAKKQSENKQSEEAPVGTPVQVLSTSTPSDESNKMQPQQTTAEDQKLSEFQYEEYFSQKQYNTVIDALEMFKNDPLLSKPGTKYLYTTHGWTLVSAVVEAASGQKFIDAYRDLFEQFGMHHTYLDENYPLIANRTSHYRRRSQKTFRLENVPAVNNSYKWAGGGVVSTVGDLLTFANVILRCYNCPSDTASARRAGCFLTSDTIERIWRPVENTKAGAKAKYAMGWAVDEIRSADAAVTKDGTKEVKIYVSHTGGAIGATSVLLLKPERVENEDASPRPRGLAVAILTNLQECGGIYGLALELARIFDDMDAQ